MNAASKAAWATSYQAALRKHLQRGAGPPAKSILVLGRRAVQLGLETLDLARIHAQALHTLTVAGASVRSKTRMAARSQQIFNAILEPIEETHRAAMQTAAKVHHVAQTLRRRTAESCASSRNLKRGIVRRQAAEVALGKSGHHQARLLRDSHRLQKQVRQQSHKMLADMERKWLVTSRQLQDEVAQTLLAIHVRLLTLKTKAGLNTAALNKELVGTQRLVKYSMSAFRKLAHELGLAT